MQIDGILADTLPLVTTNMTKDEIVSLAAGSLTYLNYPISQLQLPAMIRKMNMNARSLDVGDCLVPDLDKCRQTLSSFLFEKDIPGKAAS